MAHLNESMQNEKWSMVNYQFKLLYTATLIIAKAVIPAPYQVRGKLQQESRRRPCEGREPLF